MCLWSSRDICSEILSEYFNFTLYTGIHQVFLCIAKALIFTGMQLFCTKNFKKYETIPFVRPILKEKVVKPKVNIYF
jgi:hypothetical protein